MAKSNEESFNNFVADHLSSIDDDRLARIADSVTRFTNNYKEYVKNQQQAEKKNEILKELKENEKNRKADALKSENYLKRMAENSNIQSKMLTKILEESLDSKNVQETLHKIQEKALSSNKAMNQDIIKGLNELSALYEENSKTSEKLYSLTEDMQKENAQARIQSMLKDTKRFRLESNYWKSLTGNIKRLSSEFHDFKNNPSAWMSETMGNLFGKVTDKIIDEMKSLSKGMIAGINDALKGLGDSFFQAIDNARQHSEAVARETGYSYEDSQKTIDQINTIGLSLVRQGRANGQFLLENSQKISSSMIKNFGKDWMKNMNPEKQTQLLTAMGAALRQNVDIDKAFATFGGDYNKLYNYLVKQVNLEGAMRQLDDKQEAAVKALMMDINDQQYGLSHEQIIKMNEQNAIWGAEMAKKNEYFNEQVASELKGVFTEVAKMRDIESHLSQENIRSLQSMGIATKDLQKIMQSGTMQQKTAIVKALAESSDAGNLTPALQQLALRDSKVFDFLTSVKYESDEEIRKKFGKDYINDEASFLSSKSKMEMERNAFFSAMVAMRQQMSKTGQKDVSDEVAMSWGLERLLKTEEKLKGVDFSQIGVEEITKMQEILKSSSESQQEYMKSLTSEQLKVYEFLQEKDENGETAIDRASQLVKDMGTVAYQASLMSELGFDKALTSGGLSGLLGAVVESSMGAAFSPEQEKKLKEFLSGIGGTLKPVFNVLKTVMIDPILDTLHDVIGSILGDIYVSVQKIKSKIFKTDYTPEQEQFDRLKYLSTKSRNDAIASGSFDIKSESLNTGGRVLGSKTIGDLDLSDQMTSEHINEMLSGITIEYNADNKSATTKGAENINLMLKQSSGTFIGDDPETMIEFLAKDNSIDKSELKKTFEIIKKVVGNEYGNDLNELFGLEGMGSYGGLDYTDAKQILASYLLLKSNLDLYANSWGGAMFYSLRPHSDKAPNHFILNPTFGDEQYYANGGVIAATSGGKRVTVGEAGYDEIIIPTDPAKQSRAQELLRLAQDKYGLYASNPDGTTQELRNQMEELLFDLRILMIQLDPMRDIVAMQHVMSAFNILKNVSSLENSASSLIDEGNSGGSTPFIGTPIQGASGLDAIRKRILDEAISMSGKPYGTLPKGIPNPPEAFVCNQLVNWAYAHALGASNYRELLASTKLPQMYTVAGFIDYVGKNFPQAIRARGVSYSDLNGIAKPGDMIFTGSNAQFLSPHNPDNHSHTGLYISNSEWIDASSLMVKGKQLGVGVHTPRKEQKYMLMNFLDQMPLSWYQSKGLISAMGIEDEMTKSSYMIYSPSLQSTPNASYVSDQVSRANRAKIEREQRRMEKQERESNKIISNIVKNAGLEKSSALNRGLNIYVSPDKTFCTSGQATCSPVNYSMG